MWIEALKLDSAPVVEQPIDSNFSGAHAFRLLVCIKNPDPHRSASASLDDFLFIKVSPLSRIAFCLSTCISKVSGKDEFLCNNLNRILAMKRKADVSAGGKKPVKKRSKNSKSPHDCLRHHDQPSSPWLTSCKWC